MKEDYVIEQFRKNGYKITPQRQEILKAFMGNNDNHPLSAEEIHRKVVESYPNVGIDTVYRNLIVFLDLGIINKLNFREGKSRYELNSGKHHHHLVCLNCGMTEVIDYCPFKTLDREKIEEEKKFEIKKHSFELFGYCELCREKKGKEGSEKCVNLQSC
ncbi:MAG: Ferric uptake regulation protein [Pelotomaculum sp. PtaU1.Bin065]|nr:MAG: Ferric uptake regulation protein [Pelotomaculum sp. PtaU1.Bin065]